MRTFRLIIAFTIYSLHAVAQQLPIEEWVNRLKDESKTQVIKHYTIYYDLAGKFDSASRVRAAIEIDAACAKGNERLRLLGRSVKAKLFFYYLKAGDSLYASQMKACLNEAVEMEDPYLQAEFGRWYSEMLNSLNQQDRAIQYAMTSLRLHDYLG